MRIPLFVIKYTKYEYWPWWLFYLPILPYWLYLSIKCKSMAYFSIANPGIELGGFFGESKSDILKLINKNYLPNHFIVEKNNITWISSQLLLNNIKFPLIVKPDVGERGNNVTKILSINELETYNSTINTKYIIQEFIDYEIELGVLYCRMPNSEKGFVTSITLKEFLYVKGDGKSTILELMQYSTRARFQIKRLTLEMGEKINEVLKNGELKIIEPIGNHCRGTRFIDNNYLINENLNHVFDQIASPIIGFYYGRFDLKVKSIEDLYNGTHIKIMELNGASSEPGHIYDASKITLIKAYKDLKYHWKLLAEISKQNIERGLIPVSFLTIIRYYFRFVVLKK